MIQTRERTKLFTETKELGFANHTWQLVTKDIPSSVSSLAVMLHFASRDGKLTPEIIQKALNIFETTKPAWNQVNVSANEIDNELQKKSPLTELDKLAINTGYGKISSTEEQHELARLRNNTVSPIGVLSLMMTEDKELVNSSRGPNDRVLIGKLYENALQTLTKCSDFAIKLIELNYLSKSDVDKLKIRSEQFHEMSNILLNVNFSIMDISGELRKSGVLVTAQDLIDWKSHYENIVSDPKRAVLFSGENETDKPNDENSLGKMIDTIETKVDNISKLDMVLNQPEWPLIIAGDEAFPEYYMRLFVEKVRQADLFPNSSLVEYALSIESGKGMKIRDIRDGLLYHARVDAITQAIDAVESAKMASLLISSDQDEMNNGTNDIAKFNSYNTSLERGIGKDGEETYYFLNSNKVKLSINKGELSHVINLFIENWRELFDQDDVAVNALKDYMSIGGDLNVFQDTILGMPKLLPGTKLD